MQTDQFRDTFREEAGELLTELETTLLELEDHPEDGDLVARAFRALHTIKGSGAMFGFETVSEFTHEVETVFDAVRNGRVAVSRALVDTSLRAKDVIRGLLDAPAAGDPALTARAGEVSVSLRAFLGESPVSEPDEPDEPVSPTESCRVYRIRFRPSPDLVAEGGSQATLLGELRSLGALQLIPQPAPGPSAPAEQGTEEPYAPWDAVLTTSRDEDALRDAFIFVEGRCELKIDVIEGGAGADPGYKKLGEILLEKGDVTPEVLQDALQSQKRIGDILEERGLVAPEAVKAAAVEQRIVREVRQDRSAAAGGETAASVRVGAGKLDSLVDLVGELVIAQARLSQIAAGREDAEVFAIAEEIERLTAELRDNTLNIRMLPIGTTFSKFRRVVRDLSAELGKEIELVTEGAETELDKTVIERLGDPLVHLIRNSCDHGIEPPARRTAAGKPPKGTVRLSAYHSGPNVFIEIRDDGAGLDAGAIREKALDRGLITAEARLTDRELFGLIFVAGFSTAKVVSSVSGRGVGMDVVKRSIDALRGTVEVESRHGEGTTIRIKLPLTLAIIEGLLVEVGSESFVIPLSLVEECVELTRDEIARSHGRRLAPVRGELVPYLRLREWFEADGEPPPVQQIVVANVEGERFGFAVDRVVGQHQTVIKALGRVYDGVEGLSGATILGDGSVALILDVPVLVRSTVELGDIRNSPLH